MKKLVLVSESKNYLYFIGKADKPFYYSWYRIERSEWNSKKDLVKLMYTSNQGLISLFEVDEALECNDSFLIFYLTSPYAKAVDSEDGLPIDPEAKTLDDLLNDGYRVCEDELLSMYSEIHPTIAFLVHKDFGCVGIVRKISREAIVPDEVFGEMKIKLSQQLPEDNEMWIFEIHQNGERLASGANPDKEKLLFEAMCRMHGYSEDQYENLILTVKKGEYHDI